MRLLKNTLLRLKRRRKNVFLAASCLFVMSVMVVFYINDISPGQSTSFITNPDENCGLLPSFVCRWLNTQNDPSSKNKPYDPSSSDSKGKDDASKKVPPAKPDPLTQMKLAYIKSAYANDDQKVLQKGHLFYKKILKDLVKADPKIDALGKYLNEKVKANRFDDPDLDYSEKWLYNYLQVNETEVDALTESHNFISNRLPEHAPNGLYEKDGIVLVGGGKFNWLTLLSIKSVRASGSQLPIEVFIPTIEEYELEFCAKILPTLNAKCIFMPTLLFEEDDTEFSSKLEFKGYQYKSLAILLSSFENVLLLDSDNFVSYAPDHLFVNEPFISNGLIVWPDYWRRSTSPDFYKIAGVQLKTGELLPQYSPKLSMYLEQSIPEDVDWIAGVPLHERPGAIPDPSSESGQLVISKKTHLKAVLLALYYNTYGPKYYYPLFSQGAPGEGDKETFLAASVVLKKPYYQVGKFLNAVGNFKDGEFKGHGMGQYDPVEDFHQRTQKQKLINKLSGDKLAEELAKFKDPKMLFLHANFPKLDPWELKEKGETVDKDGRHRMFGYSLRWRTGVDLEQKIWDHMYSLLCEDKFNLDHYKNVDRSKLCAEIVEQQKYIKETESKVE